MTAVGLLHTVPSLAVTFDGMLARQAPQLRRLHVSDAWLLAEARRACVTDEVGSVVARHIGHLAEDGAAAVLVTCSSIGEAAEAAAGGVSVPVVRVDAAMAEEAVDIAAAAHGRVAVLATLESTLGPTGRLVQRAAGDRPISVATMVVPGAADAADQGNRNAADAMISDAVRNVADHADVVVLAQASMAGAARAAGVAVPVLTSPAGGVRALLAAIAERAPG